MCLGLSLSRGKCYMHYLLLPFWARHLGQEKKDEAFSLREM